MDGGRGRGSRAGPGRCAWAQPVPGPRPSDLFDGTDALVGPAGQIDAELLRGAEDLLIALRSEEHTSELQSRGHLVCRLLLEKKKSQQPYQLTLSQHHMPDI